MYSPVRVSTLMRSPWLTNSGTWTMRPVSRVAGLRAPETRSPCRPGSVSVTVSSTAAGRSTPDDLVVVHLEDGGVALLEVLGGVAQRRVVDVELVVGGVVHEDVVLAVAVEVLHLPLVDDGLLELLVGPVGAVDDGAGADVLQLGADEGAALARLHVLELDDGEEPLGEVEGHAVLQVVGGDRSHH